MKQIKVGSPVQDKLSGFEGNSIARCTYLNGCIQHEVQAKADKDNKMQPNLWIDEEQLLDLTPKSKPSIHKPTLVDKIIIEKAKKPGRRGSGGGHRGHR